MSKVTYLMRILLLLLSFAAASHATQLPSSPPPLRIGLTPVFLDDQAAFLNKWRDYLQHKLARPVIFVQRGRYREIVDLLRDGKLEFAWLCGYPYIRNRNHFRLVAVPLYQDEPLYHSYLIVPASDTKIRSLDNLRGKVRCILTTQPRRQLASMTRWKHPHPMVRYPAICVSASETSSCNR